MKSINAWTRQRALPESARPALPFSLPLPFILLLLFVVFCARPAAASEPLLLPLKINAPPAITADLTAQTDQAVSEAAAALDISPLSRTKAMASIGDQTSWPPAQSVLNSLAAPSGAEYVIAGSINRLGQRFSIDLVVFDLLAENPPKYFFKDGPADSGPARLITALLKEVAAYTGRHYRYAAIEVAGNKRIDSGAILRKIKARAGDRYNPEALDQDLRNIFQMGYFDDVQIQREDTDQGMKVTFELHEKAVIGTVSFSGEDELKNDDIKEVITLAPNNIINPKEVRSSVANIKKLYKEKGFYRTEVTPELTYPTPDRVNVRFLIKEGFKAYIKEIAISGNKDFSDKELRKVMMTSEHGLFSWFTDSGLLKRDMLSQDAARIGAFYNNNGYIDVKVGEPEVEQKEEWLYITIPLQEGARYMVGTVDIAGDLIDAKDTLLEETKLGQERYFNRETLRNDVLALTDYYAARGFAYAEVQPGVTKDPDNQRVNVTFSVAKGALVHINRIIVKGNDRTRDKVIRREMKVKEGAIFDASGIKKSQERLQRLDFFEEVNVTPQPTADEDLMDVTVDVKEKATGSFSLGAGYSSVENLMFMGEISQSNFRGLGQQLSLQADISGSSSRYNFSFTEPHLNDSALLFGFDLYNWSREYDDYTRDTNGFGLRFGYPIWEKWQLFWGYGWDDTKLTDLKENASQIIIDSLAIQTTSAVKVGLSRDTRNRRYDASEGSRQAISTKYAGGPWGGDAQFTKIEASTSWYFPWRWDTVCHWKLAGGYVTENRDNGMPVFERFYLGGLNSIRGFKNSHISPKDPVTNERIGGDKMWYTNYEFIFPLVKDAGLKGLVFFDAGNVYDNDQNWDFSNVKRSIGYGFRWLSPMGPLRLEWGYNLDPTASEAQSNWDFSIGGSF